MTAAEFEAAEKDLLRYINATPVVLSLLYDLDLLPEQLERKTPRWMQMLCIASHFKAATSPATPPAQSDSEATNG